MLSAVRSVERHRTHRSLELDWKARSDSSQLAWDYSGLLQAPGCNTRVDPFLSFIDLLALHQTRRRKKEEDAITYHTMPCLRTLPASVVVAGQRASGPSFKWHRKRDVSEVRAADTRAGSCLFEEMRCARKQASGCPMHLSRCSLWMLPIGLPQDASP